MYGVSKEQESYFQEILNRVREISPNELRNTTIRIAEMNPDFIYQDMAENGDCFYERDGYPSCLIGRALSRHGVSASTLRDIDQAPFGTGVRDLFDTAPGRSDWDNVIWLSYVQEFQDQGISWGESVRLANEAERSRNSD